MAKSGGAYFPVATRRQGPYGIVCSRPSGLPAFRPARRPTTRQPVSCVKSFQDSQLYTFVDTAYLDGRDPVELARALCGGGSDVLQLRAKGASREQVMAMAADLLPVTSAAGIPLVINDHPEVARAVGAAACHLGQEDFFDRGHVQASEVTRPQGASPLLLGLSTHAPAQAARAVSARPDYIAIGPVYATATKPGARPVTLDYVRWAAGHLTIPWFVIGGINQETLEEVIEAGATRICVVSAILRAPDVGKACQRFKERIASATR